VKFSGQRNGSSITRTVSGEQVRGKLGLRSAYFTVGGSGETHWVHSSGLAKGAWTHAFTYGPKGAVVAGDWNGNRRDSPGRMREQRLVGLAPSQRDVRWRAELPVRLRVVVVPSRGRRLERG
jgi:hypothetical protein